MGWVDVGPEKGLERMDMVGGIRRKALATAMIAALAALAAPTGAAAGSGEVEGEPVTSDEETPTVCRIVDDILADMPRPPGTIPFASDLDYEGGMFIAVWLPEDIDPRGFRVGYACNDAIEALLKCAIDNVGGPAEAIKCMETLKGK